MCLKNFHRFGKRCRLYRAAIWSRAGTLRLDGSGRLGGEWAIRTIETELSGAPIVCTITMEEILEQLEIPEIDLLKIDIEGAEAELFSKGYDKWLSRVRNIVLRSTGSSAARPLTKRCQAFAMI